MTTSWTRGESARHIATFRSFVTIETSCRRSSARATSNVVEPESSRTDSESPTSDAAKRPIACFAARFSARFILYGMSACPAAGPASAPPRARRTSAALLEVAEVAADRRAVGAERLAQLRDLDEAAFLELLDDPGLSLSR